MLVNDKEIVEMTQKLSALCSQYIIHVSARNESNRLNKEFPENCQKKICEIVEDMISISAIILEHELEVSSKYNIDILN